jgi:cytochrome c biogenesis protein CcmG, thiol:disulfide interchange protein DsbE
MKTSSPARRTSRRVPTVAIVAFAAIVVAALVALTLNGGDREPETAQVTGSPTVSGQPLPDFPQGGADPALDLPAPRVEGADFNGNATSITDDGRPKIVLFLAHWCPHCQREVATLQPALTGQLLPQGVTLYSVATAIDPERPNYPPNEWLQDAGWSSPIIVDDPQSSIAEAYGLTAFPYWVFIAANGTVVDRYVGELTPDELASAAARLTSAAQG